MVFAPKKQILFYHEELVQADRSVSEAAAAGKDKECLEEFNNVRDMRDRAYEVYWSCRTKEAIELAKEAMILGRSLCPPKPMAEVKPEPMPEPPPLPLPPPPPPEPVKEPAPEEPLLMAGREHVRVEGRAVAGQRSRVSQDAKSEESLQARIDSFVAGMREAAYTFSPLSPIKVDTPVVVNFWIDPQEAPGKLAAELAEHLRKYAPPSEMRVESGKTRWSTTMKAVLSADSEVLDIFPRENDEKLIKPVSSKDRTEWSWSIRAKTTGKQIPVKLTLYAILPKDFGMPPKEVKVLERYINVDITCGWAINHYWEKLRWFLGGIGGFLSGIFLWWLKKRYPSGNQ